MVVATPAACSGMYDIADTKALFSGQTVILKRIHNCCKASE